MGDIAEGRLMQGASKKETEFKRVDSAAFTNTSLITPLRYPGGKRRLLPYIARAVAALPERPSLFVEPFAGGAAVSIGLLEHGYVQRIALSDADPLVAAFWKAVFDPELAPKLAALVESADVTIETWYRMRSAEPGTVLEQAFKCLFLNRTSFSGILNATAGPIGGPTQDGPYTVASRFPKNRIAMRIVELSKLAPQVAYVRCQDWRQTLETPLANTRLRSSKNIFWYLDPPFWEKADRLYRHYFCDEAEHIALSRAISALEGNWILSYDMAPGVIDLYRENRDIHHVSMRYTAQSRASSKRSKELLFSNVAVAHGLARRSLAIIENSVDSGYIQVSCHKDDGSARVEADIHLPLAS